MSKTFPVFDVEVVLARDAECILFGVKIGHGFHIHFNIFGKHINQEVPSLFMLRLNPGDPGKVDHVVLGFCESARVFSNLLQNERFSRGSRTYALVEFWVFKISGDGFVHGQQGEEHNRMSSHMSTAG